MKSPLSRSPSIALTVCEAEAPLEPPPSPAPSLLWQRANAQHLYVPPRAEMRPQRLAIARQGHALGSFKLNCEETPFLVNERGLNLVDRIALGEESAPQNFDMGIMEAPPSLSATPSRPAKTSAAPSSHRSSQQSLDFTPVIVMPSANSSRHRPRANSVDISWPRRLRARSAFKDGGDGGGLARSVTVSCGLSDLLNASDRPREYFAEEAVKPIQLQAFHTLSTSANTLRRKVLDSLAQASGPFRPSRMFDENDAPRTVPKTRSTKSHRRAVSLGSLGTIESKRQLTITTSRTAQADLHMLGGKNQLNGWRISNGFTMLASFSSNSSISKSLHQISNSASILKRKVFKPRTNQPPDPPPE